MCSPLLGFMSHMRNLRVCTKFEISKVGGRGRFTRVNLKTVPILEIESRLLIYKTRVIATILYRQYVVCMSLNRDGMDLEQYFCLVKDVTTQ